MSSNQERSAAAVDTLEIVKTEVEIVVKGEEVDCAMCGERSAEARDMFSTRTESGHTLHNFLCRTTRVSLPTSTNASRYLCATCTDLIIVLEQAETEYNKLKQTFEAIIKKNPLFEAQTEGSSPFDVVKNESTIEIHFDGDFQNDTDSEDEPLAITKKKRHKKLDKRKKKAESLPKVNKKKTKAGWKCEMCGESGDTGGIEAEAEHKLAMHSHTETHVKKEDSLDGSQSPNYSNGFSNIFNRIKFEEEDECDEDFGLKVYEDLLVVRPNKPSRDGKKTRKKNEPKEKVVYECEDCHAKYTSMVRLEQHRQNRCSAGKPPFICEVCGASYKHKRACDIHVRLHKGISDWKCEECNKLFPSKGALQRHNNIHTGKLNYQCDLCGKSFIHTSSFKMHKLSHSGVKPHSCDVCGLALMTRSHLKRHKRVHSGEKRHECAVCGKRFSERYNLAAHSKSHVAGAEGTDPEAPRPQRKLFRCHCCPERFERRYMLERHMRTTHGRTLERPPPTPRNTMSKLLKAQATKHREEKKDEPHIEERPTSPLPEKNISQIAPSSSMSASAWSSVYAAEFGLRAHFQH